MRLACAFLVLALSLPAQAQVYRWVDAKGRVTYSNLPPPADATAIVLGAGAKGGFASLESPPAAQGCHTLRCQGERLEPRLERREWREMQYAAARAAAAPPAPRGLDFRKYVSLQRGISEGELLVIAGEPDLLTRERYAVIYTYLPTSADPFTTTITLRRGRVAELDRVRRF